MSPLSFRHSPFTNRRRPPAKYSAIPITFFPFSVVAEKLFEYLNTAHVRKLTVMNALSMTRLLHPVVMFTLPTANHFHSVNRMYRCNLTITTHILCDANTFQLRKCIFTSYQISHCQPFFLWLAVGNMHHSQVCLDCAASLIHSDAFFGTPGRGMRMALLQTRSRSLHKFL